MGLETASFIADLNAAWPLATDERREGDDHLRLLKSCLQAQFPNLGNSVAVNPTAAELNYVDGVTSAIQAQLDEGVQIEVGMQFLCRESALPSNGYWSLVTTYDDKMPLVQNSLGLGAGGSWDSADGLTNGNTGNAGSHQHSVTVSGSVSTSSSGATLAAGAGSNATPDHTHTFSDTANTDTEPNHSHTGSTISSDESWRPSYFNAVLLQFDGP